MYTLKLIVQKRYKGGEKASRNNPKCYSKHEDIGSDNKLSFLRKSLSFKSAYAILGILEKLKNLLIIGTSGDISRGPSSGSQGEGKWLE